ncbi:MAG TPA: hypothetical protein VJC12_01655 [Candidatus Paceibacterota bacterium]
MRGPRRDRNSGKRKSMKISPEDRPSGRYTAPDYLLSPQNNENNRILARLAAQRRAEAEMEK